MQRSIFQSYKAVKISVTGPAGAGKADFGSPGICKNASINAAGCEKSRYFTFANIVIINTETVLELFDSVDDFCEKFQKEFLTI